MTRASRAFVAVAILPVLAVTGCAKAAETPAPADSASVQASSSAAATPSTSPTPSAAPSHSQAPASSSLEGIAVSGGHKEAPNVGFTAPFTIDQTRTRVLLEGTGPVVGETATVNVLYHGVNGATGKMFDENYTDGKGTAFPLDQVVPGFKKGLAGQKVGSRVLIAMPGADGYDASGGSAQADIQVGDTLLFVVDILSASLSGPEGEAQPQDPALPQVSGDVKAPVVTIPAGYTAPADTVSKVLIQGTGEAVKATDTIMVDYQEVSLKTGQVVEQSYGQQPGTAALAQLIDGWKKGLEGKTVGSRVLLVVPAKDAYGTRGNATPSIAGDDTLIFVVDILYIQPAQ